MEKISKQSSVSNPGGDLDEGVDWEDFIIVSGNIILSYCYFRR
jgi:hypothetical protein